MLINVLQHSDVKCGLLQCQNLNSTLYTYINFITSGKLAFPSGDTCHTAMFDFGLATHNPGLVPDGAQCGLGKVVFVVTMRDRASCWSNGERLKIRKLF